MELFDQTQPTSYKFPKRDKMTKLFWTSYPVRRWDNWGAKGQAWQWGIGVTRFRDLIPTEDPTKVRIKFNWRFTAMKFVAAPGSDEVVFVRYKVDCGHSLKKAAQVVAEQIKIENEEKRFIRDPAKLLADQRYASWGVAKALGVAVATHEGWQRGQNFPPEGEAEVELAEKLGLMN